jgi:hypothetical protein
MSQGVMTGRGISRQMMGSASDACHVWLALVLSMSYLEKRLVYCPIGGIFHKRTQFYGIAIYNRTATVGSLDSIYRLSVLVT